MNEPKDSGVVIMTANVAAGLARDEEIEAAVRTERPDLVCFQELLDDQANRLEERLKDVLPYRRDIADGNEGRGILSAFPIVTSQKVVISDGRPDIVALIDVDGEDLILVIGHPRPQNLDFTGLNFSYDSKRQILELGHIAADVSKAVLVGGFNMTPRNTGYRRLREAGLVDAWAQRGEGPSKTFMVRLEWLRSISKRAARWKVPPVVRFDYIFCTPNIEIERAWVGPDTGSDHAPVLARVRIPAG